VRGELEKWKRYVITIKPEDAELLIAVRTGRLALAGLGNRTLVREGYVAKVLTVRIGWPR
jgi:hypothetical protein